MSYLIDEEHLPDFFPTQNHDAAFWEALGRTVATFGFLEDTLRRAIFFFTGTVPVPDDKIATETDDWIAKLEKALSDPLGPLTDVFIKSVKAHPSKPVADVDQLEQRLRDGAKLRNALCHGSWGLPNGSGASRLKYMERRSKKSLIDPIDVAFLTQVQTGTCELIIDVVNSVTILGYAFPGTNGPGEIFWSEEN
ncbi:hypothetical protein HW561_09585 [Rhodobacteraceae bacterium B1Z28]|uniref:RiboL-PSP-HEPN domain-containing protein n=1 Tax=Ruegeria haliotis TaxID=2747601 RepID=A0ABX2PPI7_9RHOB|nr:hypothetical protein [Ruegeria haliotis]NVO56037.1 hypothetical protein [Ruegeria haliotis]